MHLIEILLPVFDNDGERFPETKFTALRAQLTERFGGATAFMRAPAHGTNEDGDKVQQDDIVIVEVMAENLDRDWWATYRRQLEKDFAQDEIVIRATSIDRL
jgi:hypothetical protein